MKSLLYMGILSSLVACITGKPKRTENATTSATAPAPVESVYNITIPSLDGQGAINMADYKGKYLVVVNTASECGYTPQYKDLQEFYSQNKGKNIEVIGCPCNQFGGQEPGSAAEIGSFCQKNYGVTFPLSEKIEVKGANQHPLYQWLTQKSKNGLGDFEVKWNFNKFIITPEGRLSHYFGSRVKPSDSAFMAAVGLR